MKKIGAHVSITKGILKLDEVLKDLNADTCQIFTKAPMRFGISKIKEDERENFAKKNISAVVHGNYLTNLINLGEKTLENFYDDIKATEELGIKYYLFHPGSDVKKIGEKKALQKIIDQINAAHKKFEKIHILVENMAGQGTVLPFKLEQLKTIVEGVECKERIGVCLDTCHLFAAGYDFRTKEKYEKTMEKIDKILGIEKIKVIHLNDSKHPLGSKKDRHEELGKGKIGIDVFKFLMEDERFDEKFFILETPNEKEYKNEIALLKSFLK